MVGLYKILAYYARLNLLYKELYMSNHDLSRLFDQFNQLAVGYGPMFRDFTHSTSAYPPHNIITIADNKFNLELAVAGFKKNEISISEENGVLTIMADKDINATESQNYQYRGIAGRAFSKKFRIAEHFEIMEALLEDGILTIKFVKIEPEYTCARM